jgi:ring-1,2-phenylacetyl-CoA epoxidase subunit PaaC
LDVHRGIGVAGNTIKEDWTRRIAAVTEEATLALPQGAWMQEGGKEGRHSEHLGYILAEMQFMQRAYPGMEW